MRTLPIFPIVAIVLGLALPAELMGQQPKDEPSKELADSEPAGEGAAGKWQSMFDGKTLAGWKSTNFGGEGNVEVADGSLMLEIGSSLTGVNYTRPFPKTNYEVQLEAMRVEGSDFFCGLTFPVADSFCSWIVGGWGGGVVGLSSLDGMDASENETTTYMKFDNKRWYRLRLRVTPQQIQAWIDDKSMIDVDITGRKIATRSEVDLSQPFGIATWETSAALRKIQYRRLEPQPAQRAN